ncbi:hypothetical protein [Cypionkella sp.]|uniref:hypothetical protein n=1 Tax=Cypionkella sp. TaxID=2811411 RepID=UPI003752B3AE
MLRRICLALIFAALPLVAVAGTGVLAEAYAALPAAERISIEQEMQIGGFYDGPQDGSFSAAVLRGIEQTAQQIFASGYEGAPMDLTTLSGASAFLSALAKGDLSIWIYGAGEELDG